MNAERDAVRLLAYVPHCTDAAVEKLADAAKPRDDAAVLSDLAAAYYVRAQRNALRLSDLVRALDAADAAVDREPRMVAARFNRALALEALGFIDDAIASWDELRRDAGSGWAIEAAEHWNGLRRERTLNAAVQWPADKQRLAEAARAGDRKAVEALVARYVSASLSHVEDTVLPAWAEGGRDAGDQLVLAEMIAAALEERSGDRYLLDVIRAIRAAPQSRSLRHAHITFRDARREEQQNPIDRQPAGPLFRSAERLFAETGSPLRLTAMFRRAIVLSMNTRYGEARDLLKTVQREGRRYPSVLARVHDARGYLYTVQGRNLDAIAEYGRAQAFYRSIHDAENVARTHHLKAGLFRLVGQEDQTWRELIRARRIASSMSNLQSLHGLLGEHALASVAIGYPGVGLRFQNRAVQLLRDESSRDPDNDPAHVAQMRSNLGMALRARASIRLRLKDVDGARADLDEALPLLAESPTADQGVIASGLRARIAEVRSETEAKDAKSAIGFLTEAIAHASATQYLTLTASLLTARAELFRRNGQRAAAVADLERTITILRAEEQGMLEGNIGSETDRIWPAYFARYQDAYRQLIALRMGDGAAADGFEYAEKARAYEPLHRILQRQDVPERFRMAIVGGEPLKLLPARRLLPNGTFLLEYCVLKKQTFVWLLWNGGSEHWTLPIGNDDIALWLTRLQVIADERRRELWQYALQTPYQALLAEPMEYIARLHAKDVVPKLIVVPDGAMHGLPFAALHTGRDYLLERYRVSVAASATLYTFSLDQDRQLAKRRPQSVLIVAEPDFDQSLDIAQGLPPLSSAGAEADRIEQLYKPVITVTPPLRNRHATIPAFLTRAKDSTVVHVSAHSIANPAVPSQSFLLLAPARDDSGILDAGRLIAELHLDRTRLVVLSACSTAGGTRIGPEGLAPLVRPLIAAGVPGVVGTLWNVTDQPETAELLVRFHQNYRDGNDADEALRRAQLSMLKDHDLTFSNPRVWAPFQMIGYSSSPFVSIPKTKKEMTSWNSSYEFSSVD